MLAKAAQDAVSEGERRHNRLDDVCLDVEYFNLAVDSSATTTEASLLPIISSQRERFRMRNLELEAVSFADVSCFPLAFTRPRVTDEQAQRAARCKFENRSRFASLGQR